MPNIITIVFTSNPSTEPVEFPHPVTGAYVTGTQNANGTWQTVHTGVTKGTYAGLTGRLKNYPTVTASIAASGPVLNNVLATPTGAAATGTSMSAINVAVSSIANQAGYRLLACDTSGGTFVQIYQGSAASFAHTGLTVSQAKYYKWQYVGGAGTFYDDSLPSAVFSGAANGPLNLIAAGDSRTNGDYASATHSYCEEVARALGITLGGRLGYSGFTSQQLNDQHLADVKATFVAGKTNAVLLRVGTNDLYASGLAAAKVSIVQLITNLLNSPGFVVEVHWVPEINRRDTYATATFDADRLALNAYLKTYALAGFHYVTPLENEPAFYSSTAYNANLLVGGTATDNVTISKEGVHEIDQGTFAIGALVIAPYLASYYNLPAVAGTAPLALANNTTNVLTFQHIMGMSALEVMPSGGAFTNPAAASYAMGSGATAANAYAARLKALAGRAVSAVVTSPAFAALPAAPPAPVAVTWANFRNAAVDSGQLHLISETALGGSTTLGWNGGSSSTAAIGAFAGSTEVGRLSFPGITPAPGANGAWMSGLMSGASYTGTVNPVSDAYYNKIKYAIYRDGTSYKVFESGAQVGPSVAFAAGSTAKLEIVVFNAYVSYQRDGVEFYRSLVTPALPLYAEACFYKAPNYATTGGYLSGVLITAANSIASGF